MLQDIVDYLNGGSRDFDSGFALFRKYSRNRNLISWIERKRSMPKLLYELQKLAGRAEVSAPIVQPFPEELPRLASSITDSILDIASGRKIRTYDERRTNRGDLPERLQKVYDDISDLYKLRRAWHEKMKFARTDIDRAKCRERLLETHGQITKGWKMIDNYLSGKEADSLDASFKESSCRAYISKFLKKDTLTPEQLQKLHLRVTAMLKHGCTFSEPTKVALQKWGISL